MISEPTREMAEEMPEYQTSRGEEFRDIPVSERYAMARRLVIARTQASNDGWDEGGFRKQLRHQKEIYMHAAGELGVDIMEAANIWWKVVYGDPAPAERNNRDLI